MPYWSGSPDTAQEQLHDGASGSSVPLMTKRRVDQGDVVFDGDEELESHLPNGNADPSQTEVVPYAHRDLKPG